MARRRSNGYNSKASVPRVADETLTSLRALSGPFLSPVRLLQPLDDGRYWHPDPEHGALTVGGRYANVVVHSRPLVARSKTASSWIGGRGVPVGVQVPVGVRFESPYKVLTCVRRKIRREVIFARDKAGRGVKRRQPRRNWRSNVVC